MDDSLAVCERESLRRLRRYLDSTLKLKRSFSLLDEGFDIATDMLQSNPEITVLFGRADGLALGAAAAARAQDRDDIIVVGFDGDDAGLLGVQDGTLAATVTQPTNGMGRQAVDAVIALLNGETLPAEMLQPGVLTTVDNVAEYIAEHP